MSIYISIMLFGLSFYMKVSVANPAIDISRKSPQHIHTPSNKELHVLSLRTIKHGEFCSQNGVHCLKFLFKFWYVRTQFIGI